MSTRSFLIDLMLSGFLSLGTISAQTGDSNLAREVEAVRAEVARSRVALRQYTWTEHTEVLVNGSLKSARAVVCRYGASGELTRTPIAGTQEEKASAISKRPGVRKKADLQDYIERAITRIHNYVPPIPERIQYLLEQGYAARVKSETGKSELRFSNYFERGDSLVFTYDPVSKVLLRATIASTLGSPKDPVTLDVVFEPLPDGINRVTSTTLKAKKRNIQVNTRNGTYQKAPS